MLYNIKSRRTLIPTEVQLQVDGSAAGFLFISEEVGSLMACAVITELPTDPTVNFTVNIVTEEIMSARCKPHILILLLIYM